MDESVQAKRRVWVIEERSNPSTDFFLIPALSSLDCSVRRYGHEEPPPLAELVGSTLVFVRYLPARWATLVEENRSRFGTLIYFMDDDLLDTGATTGLPWRYRLKLARLAGWRSKWLKKHQVQLWVSTPFLQQKYAAWRPKLVLPSPLPASVPTRRVFYHGSAAHHAEIDWLHSVIDEVLRKDERISFEIIGGERVRHAYAGLQRVCVIHQMGWDAYQALLEMPGRHVGLAPALDSRFNRARSYTKFFDITRCGAVGVYASNSVYGQLLADGSEGLLAGDDRQAWIDAILRLASDERLRLEMHGNALRKMTALKQSARDSHEKLI